MNLKDIQSQKDHRKIEINKVGVKSIRYPIIVLDKKNKTQHTVATINMYVNLPHHFKGTHMSRFIEILNTYRQGISIENLSQILIKMKEKLHSESAHMEIEFPYCIEKQAPVTKAKSLMEYTCHIWGTHNRKADLIVGVEVPLTTLCPCSKEISNYGAHNQRSRVMVNVRFRKFFWIEDLIEIVETCASSEVYPRHYPTEGPGYFAIFLERRRIPWSLVRLDAGESVPADPGGFSGLVFMGGPMSVNESLPWIPAVLDLIRGAVAGDVPVLGHCLGGQLMSKALGGVVSRNPVKEIGWGAIRVTDAPVAREWLGDVCLFDGFHWHGETFSIPAGAIRILESMHCPNQAFAMGPHLGMQCHVEMTVELVRAWCESGAREIAASPGPAVQGAEAIPDNLERRVAARNSVADRIYSRWVRGLRVKK